MAPEILTSPEIAQNNQGMVSIICETSDPVVTYTTDGSEPTIHSETFTAPFVFTEGGTVKAKAFINKGNQSSETISAGFDVAPAK